MPLVLAQRGALHAPEICSHILQRDISKEEELLPPPSSLGGSALEHILPFLSVLVSPLAGQEKEEEHDPLLKLIDQVLLDGTNAEEKPILLDNTALNLR